MDLGACGSEGDGGAGGVPEVEEIGVGPLALVFDEGGGVDPRKQRGRDCGAGVKQEARFEGFDLEWERWPMDY